MLSAMIHADRYAARRAQLTRYFGATAADNWAALTSDAPTNFVRRAVRAGRDEMRHRLLSWLPVRMTGLRVMDAGCGTGSLAIEAARRGATVVGIDVADAMIEIARDRTPAAVAHRVEFIAGDMLDASLGEFDHVVAMDSLIHYDADDVLAAVASLATVTRRSLCFTVAPLTPALAARHAIGKLFPRSQRSPDIAPVSTARLQRDVAHTLGGGFAVSRTARVGTGFYVSQAIEVVRSAAEAAATDGRTSR
jgi:magnesium-protoporphyrin O-methyltransferase